MQRINFCMTGWQALYCIVKTPHDDRSGHVRRGLSWWSSFRPASRRTGNPTDIYKSNPEALNEGRRGVDPQPQSPRQHQECEFVWDPEPFVSTYIEFYKENYIHG